VARRIRNDEKTCVVRKPKRPNRHERKVQRFVPVRRHLVGHYTVCTVLAILRQVEQSRCRVGRAQGLQRPLGVPVMFDRFLDAVFFFSLLILAMLITISIVVGIIILASSVL
jgi:hypothetical protein